LEEKERKGEGINFLIFLFDSKFWTGGEIEGAKIPAIFVSNPITEGHFCSLTETD